VVINVSYRAEQIVAALGDGADFGMRIAWSREAAPDLLALQETKIPDEHFPAEELNAAGWEARFVGQRSYNGVATLSREPVEVLADALPGFADDARRLLATRAGDLVLVNTYVPNGKAVGSEKYEYKLAWLVALGEYLAALRHEFDKIAVLGDFNIAPEDRDVHDPAAWEGKVLASEPERAAFGELTALGFTDAFRLFDQPPESYSWWDYRQAAFRRNRGLRIDHLLVSRALADSCRAVAIDRAPRSWDRPSDHAPVMAEFD
jgi:exodeoxyribonuclease-3